MDAKLIKDARVADLLLSSFHVAAKVQDIPGADIDSDNVTLDLSLFGEGAEVVLAKFGSETASISVSGTIATLDFTSAVAADDLIEIDLKIKL